MEAKINTTLSEVITSDWRSAGEGKGGKRKVKGRGRGSASAKKGRGKGLRSKGDGKVRRAGKAAGKGVGKVRRGFRTSGGLVKKTMFKKERTAIAAWNKPDRPIARKGKGKGKSRGVSGKGKGKWSSQGESWEQPQRPRRGLRLWSGARARPTKGGGKGKGKDRYQDQGPLYSSERKGKGKGKRMRGFSSDGNEKGKGKGKRFRTSDGFQVRRNGAFTKQRRPLVDNGRSIPQRPKGSGRGAMGGARALALATGDVSRRNNRNPRGEATKLSEDERRMMKKITIVAQLDRVPKPTPAMQGFVMRGASRGAERAGSLSRRFGGRR